MYTYIYIATGVGDQLSDWDGAACNLPRPGKTIKGYANISIYVFIHRSIDLSS